MATGRIMGNPNIVSPTQVTGFASTDGFKNVLADKMNGLSLGELAPVYCDLSGITLSPFYQTYYSGFLTKLTASRGWGLLSDVFGVLVLCTFRDGEWTFTSK